MPGRSCTTTRSSPRRAFRIELLPTFGRPMMQIAGSLLGSTSARAGAPRAAAPRARRAGRRCPGRAGPTPRGRRRSPASAGSGRRPRAPVVALVGHEHQRAPGCGAGGRRPRGRRPSGAVWTSTTNSTRSASSMPAHRLGGDLLAARRVGSASSMPPVSMSWKARPFHSAPAWRRSRVTPGDGVDHGVAPSGEAVEERRLADVRVARRSRRWAGRRRGCSRRPPAAAARGRGPWRPGRRVVSAIDVPRRLRWRPARPRGCSAAIAAIMRSTAWPGSARLREPLLEVGEVDRAAERHPRRRRASGGCPRWPPGPR